MSLSRRSADALIGLLVLTTIGLMLAAIAVTRGWNERRILVYMLSPSVQDLKVDSRVKLQGLEVGEVAGISPRIDSAAMGRAQFVVALRLRERFQDGTPMILPRNTHAELASSGLVGAMEVSLLIPEGGSVIRLEPGDTIIAEVRQSATDALKEVADSLKTQVSDVLRDTRRLLGSLDRTATTAQTELAATGPEFRATLESVQRTMATLRPAVARAESLMTNTDARLGALQDSIRGVLGDAHGLMGHLDSLALVATGVATDNRQNIQRTVSHLYVVSAKLEHFLDQVSRRPLRMITGVRPLDRDSIPGGGE
jgi:ABC-type transporter Mla subunit MlaD